MGRTVQPKRVGLRRSPRNHAQSTDKASVNPKKVEKKSIIPRRRSPGPQPIPEDSPNMQAIVHSASQQPPTGGFARLPQELRDMIWAEALPPPPPITAANAPGTLKVWKQPHRWQKNLALGFVGTLYTRSAPSIAQLAFDARSFAAKQLGITKSRMENNKRRWEREVPISVVRLPIQINYSNELYCILEQEGRIVLHLREGWDYSTSAQNAVLNLMLSAADDQIMLAVPYSCPWVHALSPVITKSIVAVQWVDAGQRYVNVRETGVFRELHRLDWASRATELYYAKKRRMTHMPLPRPQRLDAPGLAMLGDRGVVDQIVADTLEPFEKLWRKRRTKMPVKKRHELKPLPKMDVVVHIDPIGSDMLGLAPVEYGARFWG